MFIGHTDSIWHDLAIVGCKNSVPNSRLSKCHNLNVLGSKIQLGIKEQTFNTTLTDVHIFDNDVASNLL